MTEPYKRNAPGQGGASDKAIKQIEPTKYSPESTASEAQRERIIQALRSGPKTSYELRRMGCYQQSTRIFELRRMGFRISTEFVTLTDRDGFRHPRCARYHLHGEPPEGLQ